jgi:cytochrome bd ubiquinol oxidase subunit I
MDSALLVHRLHFAFTVTFHYLFPQLTMGLAPLIVVLKTLALRHNDEPTTRPPVSGPDFRHQLRHRRGDRNSHGISVRHELVALLALRRRRDRADAGHGRLFAFFLESAFLGLFLYGEKRLSPGALVVGAAVFWARGSRVTSSSPPTLGCSIRWATRVADGSVQLTSFWELVLNPWAWWQYAHNMSGAVITGAFVMASVGAFYLLWGKFEEHGRIFVRVGVVAALFSVSAVVSDGRWQGRMLARNQPVTLAAMEALFDTKPERRWSSWASPNVRATQDR